MPLEPQDLRRLEWLYSRATVTVRECMEKRSRSADADCLLQAIKEFRNTAARDDVSGSCISAAAPSPCEVYNREALIEVTYGKPGREAEVFPLLEEDGFSTCTKEISRLWRVKDGIANLQNEVTTTTPDSKEFFALLEQVGEEYQEGGELEEFVLAAKGKADFIALNKSPLDEYRMVVELIRDFSERPCCERPDVGDAAYFDTPAFVQCLLLLELEMKPVPPAGRKCKDPLLATSGLVELKKAESRRVRRKALYVVAFPKGTKIEKLNPKSDDCRIELCEARAFVRSRGARVPANHLIPALADTWKLGPLNVFPVYDKTYWLGMEISNYDRHKGLSVIAEVLYATSGKCEIQSSE